MLTFHLDTRVVVIDLHWRYADFDLFIYLFIHLQSGIFILANNIFTLPCHLTSSKLYVEIGALKSETSHESRKICYLEILSMSLLVL